ncbi:hypothetical protein ACHAXR_012632 [Thalassiosira sp. AJA248-18]
MWKAITSATFLAFAMVAFVQETTAFSNNMQTTTITSCSRASSSSPSALAESFDDEYEEQPKKKGFFGNFFEELDAFVDDATSRRLGNGAQYYGKRKSSFYGENDVNKKKDRDYRGPANAGYFKWMQDPDTGEMKPVTRLKEVNIEKKSRF